MLFNGKYRSSASILSYHSIDSTGSIISVSAEKFRRHMQCLKEGSTRVVSLTDVRECLKENRPFPPNSIIITFDDGFKNFYDVAYPILKEFGFSATVFLVPGYCGKANKWKDQPKQIPTLDLMDWNQIAELAKYGIDFGAHTVNHPNLSDLPYDTAVQEIVDSKSMIESHLGREVSFFAYPYGKLDDKVRTVIQKEFSGACSTDLGFVSLKSDIYSLPRIDMYYFSENNLFEFHGRLIFTIYVKLRRLFRAFKPYTPLNL